MFDIKVIYQQRFEKVDIAQVPPVFLPETGPLGLRDWEKVYSGAPSAWTTADIFEERELSRDGVVVVVRPDQYVAAVLPLSATGPLGDFFDGALIDRRVASAATRARLSTGVSSRPPGCTSRIAADGRGEGQNCPRNARTTGCRGSSIRNRRGSPP